MATTYVVRWTLTEEHEAKLTAEQLADLVGLTIDEVTATPEGELTDLGDFANALAEIECGDTYDGGTVREDIGIYTEEGDDQS